ncbi:MAG TPA: ATP-binding protein [Pseudonocardia sp.]|jgi:anti-sigma regulatory factor (Ser/Thr protein kinase)|nr:ATP-binding protein [Pseudonocardia sp.]
MRPLHCRLTSQPSLSHDEIRDWLDGLSWPAAERDALLLAVAEAIGNAVEHAYHGAAGEVTVRGRQEFIRTGLRQVVLTVTDQGRWRSAQHCQPPRGQGLGLIRELTAELRIEPGPSGTRVRLVSRPVARLVPTRRPETGG